MREKDNWPSKREKQADLQTSLNAEKPAFTAGFS